MLICLVVSCALVTTVLAEDASNPPLPQFFNGSVADNLGNPALAGTEIAAYIDGKECGSIVTTKTGAYGWVYPGEPTLIVVGDKSGQQITFYVNGISAQQTTTFASGEVTRLSLTTREAIPAVPPGSIESVEVTMPAGQETPFSFPGAGLWIGLVTETPLSGEQLSVARYPGDQNPVNAGIAGLSGMKFVAISTTIPASAISKVTFRMYYTDAEIAAAGLSEDSLKITWWDGSAWQDVTTGRNMDQNYVEAVVDHFSIYGLFGAPAVPPTPTPGGGGGGSGGGGLPVPSGGTGGSIFSGDLVETGSSDTQPSNVTETPEITPTETVTVQPEETATAPVTTGSETSAPIGEVPMLAIIGVVILAVAAVGGIFFLRRQ